MIMGNLYLSFPCSVTYGCYHACLTMIFLILGRRIRRPVLQEVQVVLQERRKLRGEGSWHASLEIS